MSCLDLSPIGLQERIPLEPLGGGRYAVDAEIEPPRNGYWDLPIWIEPQEGAPYVFRFVAFSAYPAGGIPVLDDELAIDWSVEAKGGAQVPISEGIGIRRCLYRNPGLLYIRTFRCCGRIGRSPPGAPGPEDRLTCYRIPSLRRLTPALLAALLCCSAASAWEHSALPVGSRSQLRRKASIVPLPFFFYSQFFRWTAGVYLRTQDLVEAEAQFDLVLFGSTNGTLYLYHQMRGFRVPGIPRLYVEPTVFFGRFGEIRAYTDMPGNRLFPTATGERYPGHNDSDPGEYLLMEGGDQWYRINLRWLLPIGDGTDATFLLPRLHAGRLVTPPYGGHSANPFRSGHTFLEVEPFYRNQVHTVIGGATFALTRENWDFVDNPSRGSYQRVSIQRNTGSFGSDAPWTILELDLRWYVPLSAPENPRMSVLALDVWTMNCTTWNHHHVETDAAGRAHVVWHRPPAFAAPALGSDQRFRAYYQNRFNDRAMFYTAAEWRRILGWNPLQPMRVHWIETALFAEAGRVAPRWSLSKFSHDVKISCGGGVRVLFTDLVTRMDLAFGNESPRVQMFMSQAF